MSDINIDVTPESLLDNFKGPGLIKMVVATVVLHAVLLIGSSFSFFKEQVFRAASEKTTKEERVKHAVEAASIELRKIAEQHGVSPQDISDQFGGGASRTAVNTEKAAVEAPVGAEAPVKDTPAPVKTEDAVPKVKSEIEKKIETKVEGPKLPAVGGKDDIF